MTGLFTIKKQPNFNREFRTFLGNIGFLAEGEKPRVFFVEKIYILVKALGFLDSYFH
jgi:hypothetical protein